MGRRERKTCATCAFHEFDTCAGADYCRAHEVYMQPDETEHTEECLAYTGKDTVAG